MTNLNDEHDQLNFEALEVISPPAPATSQNGRELPVVPISPAPPVAAKDTASPSAEEVAARDELRRDDASIANGVGGVRLAERSNGAAAAADACANDRMESAWTDLYPADMRDFLLLCGVAPDKNVHAHEFNLGAMETARAFESALSGPGHDPFWGKMFLPALAALAIRLGLQKPALTMEENLAWFERRTELPPRCPDEVAVRADWLSDYPAEYARILGEHGVATVPGTQVSRFNRRLVELLAHDCVDEAMIWQAKESALTFAFGGDWLDMQDYPDEPMSPYDRFEETLSFAEFASELHDDLWAHYREEDRALLQSVGRHDFEHPNAAAFNRAIAGVAASMREYGLGDQAALLDLRRLLWTRFFADEPCLS